jgi:regulator of sirC expression with transglutaminase-like and TPR domain
MSGTSHRASFTELVQSESGELPLDRAALLIAAEEYVDLSIDCYLAKLDDLAERVGARLHRDAGPYETLARMQIVLVDEEGFTGNTDRYYDPRNSFLNDVLDRRLGIPIALSTVYMEVARRIGFSLHGVGFPGHFLVKHRTESEEIVVDPFHQGRILAEDDLKSRLEASFGGKVRYEPSLLDPLPARELLFRMLSNLKSIYVRSRDTERALAAVERMLVLCPENSREHRDRGVLLAQVGRPLEALAVLATYRELEPDAEDADQVHTLMEQLKVKIGMAN